MQTNRRNSLWYRLILAIVLLCLILVGFFFHIEENRRMTVDRNARYIADASAQTAKRIDDILLSAEDSISAIADIFERSLDPQLPHVEILEELTETTVFDYIGYVDKNGIYTDNGGRQALVADRHYYIDGMKGNVGVDIVEKGRVSGEELMIFYAPLHQDGEVVGILTGRYRRAQINNIITSTYFGKIANTYLCLSDGTVIASSTENRPENIIESLSNNQGADKKALAILENALSTGTSASFSYSNSYGSSAANVTPLSSASWMLLEVFPMEVTNEMLEEDDSAALFFLLWLVALSAIYITILLIDSHREKKSLAKENRLMEEILENTSMLFSRFIVADLRNDHYTCFNSGMAGDESQITQTGSYSSLCDYWKNRLVSEENNECFAIASIQENLTEEIPYLQYENRIKDNGDGVRWMQLSIISLKREKGVAVSVLMTVQDVTELKEKEAKSKAALEDAYLSAQAANDAKRTFLFDMSHDMRTPMNAIIGLSELLAKDAEKPDKVRSYSSKISSSGKHLLSLVNEVLDMSKIDSGKNKLDISPFSLSQVLEELNSLFQPMAKEKHQSLDIKVHGVKEERLLGDKLRFSQLLENLLINAVRYTPEGGEISLVIQGLEENTKGFVHLMIQVSDNGIGISKEFKDHVFEPYSRENNSTASGITGAGLGMTIAKNIVDLMGGNISLESEKGKGSTFTVELELRPAEEGTEEFWKEKGISRALVLGPEKEICLSIKCLMANTGVDVSYSTDASQLSGLSGKNEFDLILLDRAFPEMDNMESISLIRGVFGSRPILILIEKEWMKVEEESRKSGADCFLPIPFSLSSLMGVVLECRKKAMDSDSDATISDLKILVAEDNEINAEILVEYLDMEGALPERAIDGKDAVEIFRKSEVGYFDVILMDIQMPNLDGYQATLAIRNLSRPDAKTVPIVAMTANSFADDVRKSLDCGMDAHLSKPVDPRVLRNTIRNILSKRKDRTDA